MLSISALTAARAQMEAEHQLMFLQKNKKIDWIYTIDSDVLPLGATNVIY